MQALKLANWSKKVIVEFYLDEYLTVTFVCAACDPIVHYFAHDIIKSVCLFRSMMQVKVPTKANGYLTVMETFQIESYVPITSSFGEELTCSHEIENTKDPFAVAVKCRTMVVGHVPHKISAACALFMAKK